MYLLYSAFQQSLTDCFECEMRLTPKPVGVVCSLSALDVLCVFIQHLTEIHINSLPRRYAKILFYVLHIFEKCMLSYSLCVQPISG